MAKIGKLFKEASPDLKDTVLSLLDPQVREYVTVALFACSDTRKRDDLHLQCRVRCSGDGVADLAGEVLQRLREEWGEATLLAVLKKTISSSSSSMIERLFDIVVEAKEKEVKS